MNLLKLVNNLLKLIVLILFIGIKRLNLFLFLDLMKSCFEFIFQFPWCLLRTVWFLVRLLCCILLLHQEKMGGTSILRIQVLGNSRKEWILELFQRINRWYWRSQSIPSKLAIAYHLLSPLNLKRGNFGNMGMLLQVYLQCSFLLLQA